MENRAEYCGSRCGTQPGDARSRPAFPTRDAIVTTARRVQHPAGLIGRTLRLMLALLIGVMVYVALRAEGPEFRVRVLVAVGGVAGLYAGLRLVMHRFGARVHRWLGAALAVLPLILMFLFGGRLGEVAASAYVGFAFLLQTLRGDGGCEAMALPAAVFRRPTHLMGILFAPIDFVEKHLTGPGGLPG